MLKQLTPMLIALSFSAPAQADQGDRVLEYLSTHMPNTEWTNATPLEGFTGYYQLEFEGRNLNTQYYFDWDARVMAVGMLINLNVGSENAANQSIAGGTSGDVTNE